MVAVISAAVLSAQPQQGQGPATFQTGTRLVEVEVVVRNQRVRPPMGTGGWFAWVLDSGPPFGPAGTIHSGLTKYDFVLLDEGKPQQLAVFHANGDFLNGDSPMQVPLGAVSNRGDAQGQPVKGATAILIDFLNTDFGCLGYERLGMNELVRSFGEESGRVALYTLGENLHVLHDFAGDPQELRDAAARLDRPHGKLPREYAAAVHDYGDLLDLGRQEVHSQMTMKALRMILQHLGGVPGRKNLVWLMHHAYNVPPSVVMMAQRLNVVLYPVLVRATGGELCEGEPLGPAQDLARATGARAFFDSKDLVSAVQTTEEDSRSAYVLGYYPSAETLDGKYHTITVKLRGKELRDLEIHYRPGYLATKTAPPPPPPSPQELFEGPVDFTGVGLAAQSEPNKEHPGLFDVKVTVDLHDIHVENKDGHFTGAFDVSVPNPAEAHSVQTGTVTLYMNNQQFAAAMEKGFPISIAGAGAVAGEIRVVVRDHSTGAAGSIRIPVATP